MGVGHTRSPTLHRWVTQQLAADLVRESVRALGPAARVLPIKGVLLSRTVYDRPEERALTDVDLVLAAPSLRAGVRALVQNGFTVQHWSSDLHIVLSTPRVPGISLDLHGRPLPLGHGRLDAAWLTVGARQDTSLFGVPVLVPDPRRTLVAVLGSIVRDLFDLAPPHVAEDSARLVERNPFPPSDYALAARDAGLARASWAALGWVLERRPSVPLAAVHALLTPSPTAHRITEAWFRAMRSAAARVPPSPLSWSLPPWGCDRARDTARGLGAFALGLPLGVLNARLPKHWVVW